MTGQIVTIYFKSSNAKQVVRPHVMIDDITARDLAESIAGGDYLKHDFHNPYSQSGIRREKEYQKRRQEKKKDILNNYTLEKSFQKLDDKSTAVIDIPVGFGKTKIGNNIRSSKRA